MRPTEPRPVTTPWSAFLGSVVSDINKDSCVVVMALRPGSVFFPAVMTFVPVFILKFPSWRATTPRKTRKGKGRRGRAESWPRPETSWMGCMWGWHFDCGGICFGPFWVSKACQCLETISLSAVTTKASSTKHLCVGLPMCISFFFGEIIFTKKTCYSFSLKDFHYQFLTWSICLRTWNPCRHDPELCRVSWNWPLYINLRRWSQLDSPCT